MNGKHTGGDFEPDENEHEPEWTFISDIFQRDDPIFRNMLFLEGCDLCSNTFIIVGDYLTVIDPGNDFTAFKDLFEHPEYDPADIKKIVLTSGLPHHAIGTIELFRYPSVKNNPGLEIIIHSSGPQKLKEMIRRFDVRLTEIKGGETLDLGGFPLKVIHTPGYTREAICLYHAPSRTLISGDTALSGAMAAPDEQAGGADQYLASLRSLLQLEIENILPGHGLPVAATSKKVIEDCYLAMLQRV